MSRCSLRPAVIAQDDFRWRWQYREPGKREQVRPEDDLLHRIAEPFRVGRKAAWKAHYIWTICGRKLFLCMPGVMSRLYAPRCQKCSKAMGVPLRGPLSKGNPYNHKLYEEGDVPPKRNP